MREATIAERTTRPAAAQFEVPPREEVAPPELYTEAEIQAANKFVIENDEGAEWYLGRLQDYKQQEATLQAQYEKRKAKIERERKSLEWLFGRQFEQYCRGRIAELPKGQTIDFWSGTVSTKNYQGGIAVVDEKLALAGAKDAVTSYNVLKPQEPKLDKAEYKKYAESELQKAKGDLSALPPGVELKPSREEFYIDLKAKE